MGCFRVGYRNGWSNMVREWVREDLRVRIWHPGDEIVQDTGASSEQQ